MLPFLQLNQKKISYLLIFLVLLLFSILILWNANWVFDIFYVDDEQFVSATAIGKPVYAWSGNGRFWPLGLFDYNWLLLLFHQGASPFVHFAYNCFTMFVTCFALFSYLNHILQNRINISLICMGVLFISSSFFRLYMTCTAPERQLILMLSLFLWCYWKGSNEHSKKHLFFTFLTAVYATYLKEPVFVIWIVFALSNLLFEKSQNTRYFNYALLMNSAIWFVLYLCNSGCINCETMYHSASFISQRLMLRSFDHDPFMFILLILGFVRGYQVVFKKERFDTSDALLFAGVAYTLVYVLINIHEYYLIVPSLILELPALGQLLAKSKGKLKETVVIFLCLCLPVSLFNSIRTINDILWHRVNDSIIFHEIIEAKKSGSKILYFSGNRDDNLNFKRYKAFFDYYSKSDFPLIHECNPDVIENNSIVILCLPEYSEKNDDFNQIYKKIEKIGLKLWHSNKEIKTEIYQNTELESKRTPKNIKSMN